MGLGIGLSVLFQSVFYMLFGLEIVLIFNAIVIIALLCLLSYDYLVWVAGLMGKKHAYPLRTKR